MKKTFDVLVVDDERVVIDSVVKVGEAEGYRIDSAEDAMTALEKMETNHYRMVICDVMMPEMDGFQFMQQLKEKGLEAPVIMTTGFSTLQNAVKALLVGAIGFLPKPFTMEELVSRLKRGLKFTEILDQIKAGAGDPATVFRQCPSCYRRLGNASWARVEETGLVVVGVVDLFLKTIDGLRTVDLMNKEELLYQGSVCAKLETDDQLTHNLLSPLSGKIIARNEDIMGDIQLIADDPYEGGWLYKVVPSNLEEEMEMLRPGLAE